MTFSSIPKPSRLSRTVLKKNAIINVCTCTLYLNAEDVNNISDYLPAEMDLTDINNQENRLPDDMASLFYAFLEDYTTQ